jgi:hypothetical protein
VSFALAPRPALAPEEVAVLVAVAEEVLASRDLAVVRSPVTAVPAWRFSGRWFDVAPFTNRRPHRRY